MTTIPAAAHVASRAACFGGAGEVAAAMRGLDWAATPLGAVESWPVSLCTAVSILLGARQSMWLVWGPRQVFLYNDACRAAATLAERHPGALGRPAAEAWPDVWPAVQERIAPPPATGRAGLEDELMLLMQRGDHLEETHLAVSFCPVPDDDGHMAGVLCTGVDDTARVLQARRMRCLRETAAIVASAQPEDAMAASLQRVLGGCTRDLPFALAYLFDDDGDARLVCASGIARGAPAAPESLASGDGGPWPTAAVRGGGTVVLHDLARLGDLPRGAWERPPAGVALVSHMPPSRRHAAGFMVVGLQPYLPWDAAYQEFVQQLADRVCAGLAVARSHVITNGSAPALAAASRSGRRRQQSAFQGALQGVRAQVDEMRRGMGRLVTTTHTLAEFSPPGGDRGEAAHEPVSLAAYTSELAGLFREAIETPELRLVVDCPPLPHLVDVDPALWEKLVFELLSNARESTPAGAITLALRGGGGAIELTVADTGRGVPAREVAQLQELAGLLGASVRVDGGEGPGNCFTVVLPLHGDPPAEAAARGRGPARPAAAAHILVADDDPDMRRYLRRVLGMHHHVEVFSGAGAALAAARSVVPDLVLVDARLPELDGAAFSRALRADERTLRVPVIQLAVPAGRAASADTGAEESLVKPFTAQELLARVAARLELARLQREAVAREEELSATSREADAMKRLQDFSARMLTADGPQLLLEEVLDATIALHRADFGVVQRVEPESGDLVIVAQRKLPEAFLAHFARVRDESAISARAMVRRERVMVEDVLADPLLGPHREVAAAAGVRAVQSTPLVSRKGEVLGVISTLFRQPHRFGAAVLRFTDLYVRHAADLVERNRAEAALLASEERFRRYFDLGLIGMALTSPTKGCIEANDELCRILGYSREELMQVHWPQLTHPDDVAADLAQFDTVLAGEQDGYVIEKRFIRKDGEAVWCTMAAQCVRAADGSVEFFVALVQDMTERLQTDEALRRAREQLAHVSRMATMGELVASIAHEISQPLAAIVGNGHAAVRWLAGQRPDHGEAVAAVQRIVADAHRAGDVVAGVRRFMQRSTARRAPVDLHACVSEVARMLEPEARARHVQLQVDPRRGKAIVVRGDAVQLQQVVLNLAMNGFDAMATMPLAQRRLRMAVEVDGRGAVRVDVSDAGHGVAPLERERIFDAFHTTRPTGMGLGLAISRSIVEAHGGRLWCTANAGGGETFSFVLPA